MVDSKIDLCVKYSLSCVGSKYLELVIVLAWLIASSHHRLAGLPYSKRVLHIDLYAHLRFKHTVACCFHDRHVHLKTLVYDKLRVVHKTG